MEHRVSRATRIYTFTPDMPPAARVSPGDLVVFETNDCYDGQVTDLDSWDRVDRDRTNPATGPVFVDGATPGNTLTAEILDIRVADTGLIGGVDPATGHRDRRFISLESGLATFNQRLRLPIDPIIGVIGVAPAQGAWRTNTASDHGGNLDTIDVKKGARVHFRVQIEGGLLALGDVHALQGDGEVSGQGIEAAAEVTLRFAIGPALPTSRVVIETPDHLALLVHAETLDEAARMAVADAAAFLAARIGVTGAEAVELLSMLGHLRISQIVNPVKTVRFCIPRSLLEPRHTV